MTDTQAGQVPVDKDRMRAQLKRWQDRLLDLSKANPLLGLNRSRVSRLLVVHPPIDAVFHAVVLERRAVRLPRVVRVPRAPSGDTEEGSGSEPLYHVVPGELAFDATPKDLQRKLRRIYDNARVSVEERGVTTLHLSFGELHWHDPQLGESISPLVLVPCELESFGPSEAMKLKAADEELQINPALELYLRERHHVEVPGLEEDPNVKAFKSFLEELAKRVREKGWKVEETIWLSTYSFETLVLYQDLRNTSEAVLENPIIAALARATPLREASEALGEERLDEAPTPEHVPVPVLSTDSSQLLALTLAREGRHLVIHGPPGTGKSQTITNLIADALGQGKTVLFVSAKMAALEVVHRRLAHLGLERFCLEAHSTKAGKATIMEELKRTLAAAEGDSKADHGEEHLEDWLRLRRDLNAYVRTLHTRRAPLNLSPYEAIARAESLRGAPELQFQLPWTDVLAVQRADLQAVLDVLEELGAHAEVFDHRDCHPWRGLAVEPGKPLRRDVLMSDLRTIRETTERLRESLAQLDLLIGPTTLLTWEGVQRLTAPLAKLTTMQDLPQDWFSRQVHELEATASLLDDAAAKAEEEASKLAEHERMWQIPPADALQLLEPAGTQFASWVRFLRPAYWRWRREVQNQLRPGIPASFGAFRSALATARRLEELKSWFDTHAEQIAAQVGAGRTRDVPRLRETGLQAKVAAELRVALEAANLVPPHPPVALSDHLRSAAATAVELASQVDCQEALDRIDAVWPRGFVNGSKPRHGSLTALLARCDEVLDAAGRLHEWTSLAQLLQRCRALGLDSFLNSLTGIRARDAAAAFARRFYTAWADTALETVPELAQFAGRRREGQVAKFRELDQKLRQSWLTRMKARASEPARRVATARGDLGTSSEVGILRKELLKQRRFKPLRKLFAEIPNVLQALKPCMLMSPLSVSTFLAPGTFSFDLVVFDEASQLPTPEGIPAILRGKQIIVAGDSKQLPPTSFFKASVILDEDSGELDEAEDLEPLESLLDDCVAIYPMFDEVSLRWHYRSRDERLIAFSNHYFYREKPLITFPSVCDDTADRGVRWVYVENGVWDRGGSRTNLVEARRVVELVAEHARRHPERSLGVVAINVTQREAIEELLEELFVKRPDLRECLLANSEEPFFVKALENVQGDERDTIIISLGYGKTASGALSYTFGPLNQEGGWRRLNVLVTRARWQTILVTSIRAHELSAVNPNNRGAVALRNFIEYAERGGRLPPEPAGQTRAETHDFEDSVAEALRARGYEVEQRVGTSAYRLDLAIRDPRDRTRYLLGIECDGATYQSAPTARDRDLLREHVLKDLGWRLHRIWSTDWFRNREDAIERAVAAIEQARGEPVEQSMLDVPASVPAVVPQADPGQRPPAPAPVSPPATARRYLPGQPYTRYRGHGDRRLLTDAGKTEALADQIVQIVALEGPIHYKMLTERLMEVNGVARIRDNIVENIERAVHRAVRKHQLERVDTDFLRQPGRTLKTFRAPGTDVWRPATWIPAEEIQLAILYIVEDQFGCQRDALPRSVAKLFGFNRVPAGFAEKVATAVDMLIEQQLLGASGLNVYLP